MSYITEGDLENHILQDIDSSYSSWIASIIGFVEEYIDKYCDTNFASSSANVIKYFDGSGTDEIFIGDFQSLTSVQVLQADGNVESTLDADVDYWKYPLNEDIKNTLKLVPTGKYSSFPQRPRALKVTGTWGWDTVPGPIKMAAIKLAAQLINEGLRGGQVNSESLGSYSVSYKNLDDKADAMGVKNILDMYRPIFLE